MHSTNELYSEYLTAAVLRQGDFSVLGLVVRRVLVFLQNEVSLE